jgi:hypothetical protein
VRSRCSREWSTAGLRDFEENSARRVFVVEVVMSLYYGLEANNREVRGK